MLPIGTMLRGDTYRVIRQLNSGGFGNTYVVENIHFGEIRAMKEFFMQGVTTRRGNTVSVSQSDNADVFRSQKEKFRKEAQRIRKLNHPNIVNIYDLFEENDTYYYIMDYIDGESLADRLKRQGAMPEREAMQVLNSLLDALSAVHAAGFTHMDIKPGNIMRDWQGKIYLIDFGASKQMTSNEQRTLSTSTAMPYTEGYAPIEQVERKMENVGPWTDLYAVGATFYRLLTNRQPPSSSEIINEANPFVFPNDISKVSQSLVKMMMQPKRLFRPQSVEELRTKIDMLTDKSNGSNESDYSNAAKIENDTVYDIKTKMDVTGKIKAQPEVYWSDLPIGLRIFIWLLMIGTFLCTILFGYNGILR